jgi:hypothetical protein
MKPIILPVAILLGGIVILSSCLRDESAQSSQEVTFSAYAKKGSRTRVAETTTSSIMNFNVFAVWSGDGKPLTNLAPASVERRNPVWEYSPRQVWPVTGVINFVAYSPDGAEGLTPNYNADDYRDMSIDYTVPDIGAQQDLLVAVNDGVAYSANPPAVSLLFQHALSRIQLKARSVVAGLDVTVYGVSFLNLKKTGNLALNAPDIPKTGGFTYGNTPLILWRGHADPTDYVFDPLASPVIVTNGGHTNVIADGDAFMTLPQETELGAVIPVADFADAVDPTDGKFYIKIVFAPENDPGKYVRYYAVKDPFKGGDTPLAFEAGRRYTFMVDLTHSETGYIRFADVEVQEMDDTFDNIVPDSDIPPNPNPTDPDPALTESYMPEPHNGFAGSHIYWDETNRRLTFDDVDVTTHERYQGVYFKWGSLVGISPEGPWIDASTPVYAPDGNGDYVKTTVPNWAAIKAGSDATLTAAGLGITDLRTSGYVTYLNSDPANLAAFKGDICAYLSGRPGIPAGLWRMPTSAEFGAAASYTRVGNVVNGVFEWLGVSNRADGTFEVPNGYTYTYGGGKTTFFPASGNRSPNPPHAGALNGCSEAGPVWSSSPNGAAASASNLNFIAIAVNPAESGNRVSGLPVRCVKK